MADGEPTTWKFPPENPRAEIDRCPRQVLTADVGSLFRALNLADGRISLLEQQQFPPVYLEALALALYEQSEKRASEMKRK